MFVETAKSLEPRGRELSKLRRELIPTHAGHIQIDEGDGWIIRLRDVERPLSGISRIDLIAPSFEQSLKRVA